MNRPIFLKFILLFLIPLSITGQEITFSDVLGSYTGDNAKGYTQPLTDAIAASMNSGMNHHVKSKFLGFEMYIDLIGTYAFIPSSSRTFMAVPEGDFEPKTPVEVPTIAGKSENVVSQDENTGAGFIFPGGYNISRIPLAYPQITIGSVYGTQFIARYFKVNIKDVGDIKYSNFGINHNLSHWLPESIPVDISLAAHFHNYAATDTLTGKGYIIMAKTSYDWKLLNFYGGLAYESSSTKYDYVNVEGGVSDMVSFEAEASNKVRFTVGTLINLGPMKLFVDYSIAKQSVLSFGLGFAINENRSDNSSIKEE